MEDVDRMYCERIEKAEKELLRNIQPLIKAKIRVYNLSCPQIKIYPDGRAETIYNFSEATQKNLDQIDEIINSEKKKVDDLITEYKKRSGVGV